MKTIERISITDSVVDSIRQLIQSGSYEVGQKLPTESTLCASLGVSRTSVREASRVLQAQGFVKLVPGKGAFVANLNPVSPEESNWLSADNARFHDYMDVRHAIELLAVRRSVERASSEQICELELIHQDFIKANEHHDSLRLIELDELFHEKIVEFTENPLLLTINKQLTDCFRVYRNRSFTNNAMYTNAELPHSRILLCFHTKNPDQAATEMSRHLEQTALDMNELYMLKHI